MKNSSCLVHHQLNKHDSLLHVMILRQTFSAIHQLAPSFDSGRVNFKFPSTTLLTPVCPQVENCRPAATVRRLRPIGCSCTVQVSIRVSMCGLCLCLGVRACMCACVCVCATYKDDTSSSSAVISPKFHWATFGWRDLRCSCLTPPPSLWHQQRPAGNKRSWSESTVNSNNNNHL